MVYPRICVYCKKSFNTSHKNLKFCSRQCYKEIRNELITCLFCGKINKFKKSKKAKFCNSDCQRKYWKDNHISWNKGLKHSEESKKKMSEAIKKAYVEGRLNSKTIVESAHKKIIENSLKKFKENPTIKIGKRGYKLIYIPSIGWVKEHHYIWEKEGKGAIPLGYVLHHINNNKLDNRIENLKLMTKKEHMKLHYLTRKINSKGQFN